MGGGVQAQLSSLGPLTQTDGPGADCRETKSLKVPKIFACGALFVLRRRVRKGLKHPPLSADPAASAVLSDTALRVI